MKNNNRWFAMKFSWMQSVGWLLLGFAVQSCMLLSSCSVWAQEIDDPQTATAPEVVPKEAGEAKADEAGNVGEVKPAAQEPQPPVIADGPQVVSGNAVTTRWKIGAKIRTGNGRATDVFMTFPVPTTWPEQTVTVIDQEIPVDIGNVTSRKLSAGVEQVVVQFPVLQANELIEISYTLEIINRPLAAPEETQAFILPRHNKKEVKPFLAASKNVNYQNSKIRKQAKTLVADHESAWDKVEAIYDWVRGNIQVQDSAYHSAQHTLKNLAGSNEDKTFLFVALCRSVKIPSRIVFAKGASYAEFMLAGPDGEQLHWFPCDVSGIREFGGLSEPRLILQKGDGFKVPEKKHAQKYVAEFVSMKGSVKPRVAFFRAEIFDDAPNQ